MQVDMPAPEWKERCLMRAIIGPGSYDDYQKFQDALRIYISVNGYVNIVLFVCICAFIVTEFFRRNRLSWCNWIGLI